MNIFDAGYFFNETFLTLDIFDTLTLDNFDSFDTMDNFDSFETGQF